MGKHSRTKILRYWKPKIKSTDRAVSMFCSTMKDWRWRSFTSQARQTVTNLSKIRFNFVTLHLFFIFFVSMNNLSRISYSPKESTSMTVTCFGYIALDRKPSLLWMIPSPLMEKRWSIWILGKKNNFGPFCWKKLGVNKFEVILLQRVSLQKMLSKKLPVFQLTLIPYWPSQKVQHYRFLSKLWTKIIGSP